MIPLALKVITRLTSRGGDAADDGMHYDDADDDDVADDADNDDGDDAGADDEAPH